MRVIIPFALFGIVLGGSSSQPAQSSASPVKSSSSGGGAAGASSSKLLPTHTYITRSSSTIRTITKSNTSKPSLTKSSQSSTSKSITDVINSSSSRTIPPSSSFARSSSSSSNPTCFPDPVYPPTASPFSLFTNSLKIYGSGKVLPESLNLNNLPIVHDSCVDFFRVPLPSEVAPPPPALFTLEGGVLRFGRYVVNAQYYTRSGGWDVTLFSPGIISEDEFNTLEVRPYNYQFLLEKNNTLQAYDTDGYPISFSIQKDGTPKLDIGFIKRAGRYGSLYQNAVRLQTNEQVIPSAQSYYGTSFDIFGAVPALNLGILSGDLAIAFYKEINNTLFGVGDGYSGSAPANDLILSTEGYLRSTSGGYATITANDNVVFEPTIQPNTLVCTPADVYGGQTLNCLDPRTSTIILDWYFALDYSQPSLNVLTISTAPANQYLFLARINIQPFGQQL